MVVDGTGEASGRQRCRDFRVKTYDLIVIGAGPSGSTCAALCAEAGMKVLLLDASRFPRDKVCGDCLNPEAWPVLTRLEVVSQVHSLPQSTPKWIRFSVEGHRAVTFPLNCGENIFAIRRRDFDDLLAKRAIELGTHFQDGSRVTELRKLADCWEVMTSAETVGRAPRIVASDGRNSIVARQLGMHPPPLRDLRIGTQTHLSHPPGFDGSLEMHIYRNGYGGLADLGNGVANLCLVANAGRLSELKDEAMTRYQVRESVSWRSISPIGRKRARCLYHDGVFLSGDAASVVEPFTGQGISLALRCGAILSDILISRTGLEAGEAYRIAHQDIYRHGLWINHFTRFLSQHPRLTHLLGPLLLKQPGLLSFMLYNVLQITA